MDGKVYSMNGTGSKAMFLPQDCSPPREATSILFFQHNASHSKPLLLQEMTRQTTGPDCPVVKNKAITLGWQGTVQLVMSTVVS